MSAQSILMELEVRKERESFKKRKFGLVKKAEQLKRVWPYCDIELRIIDHATGQWYIYRTTEGLPSTEYLKENCPDKISELLSSSDFTTDEDDSNDDGDSGRETRTSRRKMKNIRQKRTPRQVTPKKTARELAPSLPRTAQPTFLIKDILSRENQEQVGASRRVPRELKRQRVVAQKSERPSWVVPPLPVLKTCDTIMTLSKKVPEML